MNSGCDNHGAALRIEFAHIKQLAAKSRVCIDCEVRSRCGNQACIEAFNLVGQGGEYRFVGIRRQGRDLSAHYLARALLRVLLQLFLPVLLSHKEDELAWLSDSSVLAAPVGCCDT